MSHRRPRAKTTSIRTMEHLRRSGRADALRDAAPLPVAWSQRVMFCESLSGPRITEFDRVFGLTAGRDERFAEPGQQVPQPVVEQVLRPTSGTARAGAAARARRDDADPGSDGVTVAVRAARATGTGYGPLRARLRRRGRRGAGSDRRRYAGRSDPRPNFKWSSARPAWTPTSGPPCSTGCRRGRVTGPDRPAGPGRHLVGDPAWRRRRATGGARLGELITGLIGGPVGMGCSPPIRGRPGCWSPTRFGDRRVFLVGESAHVNPPWGGHGFNTSVGDAVNIAWKIAAVLRGWAAPDCWPATSRTPRRGRATVASAASNMRAWSTAAPGGGAIQRAKRPEFHSLGLVLGYCYAGSPVIQPSGCSEPSACREPSADTTSYVPAAYPRCAAAACLEYGWLGPSYDRLGTGFALVGARRGATRGWRRRAGQPGPRAAVSRLQFDEGPLDGLPVARTSSCWSGRTST